MYINPNEPIDIVINLNGYLTTLSSTCSLSIFKLALFCHRPYDSIGIDINILKYASPRIFMPSIWYAYIDANVNPNKGKNQSFLRAVNTYISPDAPIIWLYNITSLDDVKNVIVVTITIDIISNKYLI